MLKLSIFMIIIYTYGCQPNLNQNQLTSHSNEQCIVSDGQYVVQNATYNKTKNSYELFVLNLPTCVKQPLLVTGLKLGRLNKDQEKNEKALLHVSEGTPKELFIAQDYTLQMVETISSNGREQTTEPSLWSPFLSGAAGGMIGGVLAGAVADKLSKKTPSASPTKNETDSPRPTTETATKKGSNFFKNKDTATSKSGTTIYQKGRRRAKANSGFFNKRRRRR